MVGTVWKHSYRGAIIVLVREHENVDNAYYWLLLDGDDWAITKVVTKSVLEQIYERLT